MAEWPYNDPRWEPTRRRILLRDHYRCQWPQGKGICGAPLRQGRKHDHAAVVDHIEKPEDRPDLAFADANLRSIGKCHHDSARQSEQRRGYSTEIGEDGFPVCSNHPFNKVG